MTFFTRSLSFLLLFENLNYLGKTHDYPSAPRTGRLTKEQHLPKAKKICTCKKNYLYQGGLLRSYNLGGKTL